MGVYRTTVFLLREFKRYNKGCGMGKLDAHTVDAIKQAFEEFEEEDGIVIMQMYYLDQFTYEEIADATFNHISTVFRQRKKFIYMFGGLLMADDEIKEKYYDR